jgi:hypothetical protein
VLERRQTLRTRVICRGGITYNNCLSTIDCVIRNFSEDGAKIEFDNLTLLPNEFDLLIAKEARLFRAKLAWRSINQAGLTFRPAAPVAVISLDWAQRLRRSASEQRRLQIRMAQLLSEHGKGPTPMPLDQTVRSSRR